MLTAKAFWQNVFIFFLLDVFFAFLVIAIVCALGVLVHYVGYPFVPVTLQHIKKATVALSLIYLVSIFFVSCWRHLSYIKGRNFLEAESQTDTSYESVTTIEANENDA